MRDLGALGLAVLLASGTRQRRGRAVSRCTGGWWVRMCKVPSGTSVLGSFS
jgi:hypothetical protein